MILSRVGAAKVQRSDRLDNRFICSYLIFINKHFVNSKRTDLKTKKIKSKMHLNTKTLLQLFLTVLQDNFNGLHRNLTRKVTLQKKAFWRNIPIS